MTTYTYHNVLAYLHEMGGVFPEMVSEFVRVDDVLDDFEYIDPLASYRLVKLLDFVVSSDLVTFSIIRFKV